MQENARSSDCLFPPLFLTDVRGLRVLMRSVSDEDIFSAQIHGQLCGLYSVFL